MKYKAAATKKSETKGAIIMAETLTKEEEAAEELRKQKELDANKKVDTAGHPISSDGDMQKFHEFVGEFKALNQRAEKERTEFGSALGETTAKLEQSGKRLDELEAMINKKFDEFEKRVNRKRIYEGDTDTGENASKERTSLFFKFLHASTAVRCGFEDFSERRTEYAAQYNAMVKEDVGLSSMDRKTLQVGDDTLGGFNAPPEFVQELIVDLQEQNPIRGLFTARTTTNKSVQIPRQTGFLTAQWVGELVSRAETQGTIFGREEITAHEMHAQVNVSREDLEDSFFNMESFVQSQIVEQFGRTEGLAFVSGDGVSKPVGFLTDPTIVGITSSQAANFEADDLIAQFYLLLDPYVANSTFVLKRDTIRRIRQFKDGQGQYLWAAGIKTDARPATILERPYMAADAMPTVASSVVVAMFGDFRAAYTVVDRIRMEIITDIFSSKAIGAVEFSARKRVGGQVIVAQALKSLTTGA